MLTEPSPHANRLFTGASTLNQLERIFEVMGMPSKADVDAIASPFATTMIDSLLRPRRVIGWKGRMQEGCNEVALDLLSKLTTYSPTRRMMAEQGLRHPYCELFYDPEAVTRRSTCPSAPEAVHIGINDNDKKTTQLYKAKLYEAIGCKRAGTKWVNR